MKRFTLFILSFLVSFTSLTPAQTSFGSAIDFDGNGDYANTMNEPLFPTTYGTLEAWVKVRSIDAPLGNVFFEKNKEQWNRGDFYIFFETASGKIKARIQSFPSKPPMQVDVETNMSFWSSFGEWIHVAFTWGNNGMKLFINGALQADQNPNKNPALKNTYNFYVGADGYKLHNGTYVVSNFFDGQIDEVRVWNHQRTTYQIISLKDSPLDSEYFTSLDSGLVGYWKFDELEDLGINNDGPDDVRDYSVLQNHLDLAGDAHLILPDPVIPVELISFSAEFIEGNVSLKWITVTEINNLGFEIERCSENEEWRTIGFRNGHGTTTEIQNYSFIDDLFGTSSQKLFYRLKQIDYNGKYEYSDEIAVTILPLSFNLYQNFPNPFNPTTNIKYALHQDSYVDLNIYDLLGNKVLTLFSSEQNAGLYTVVFDGSNIASGAYYYMMIADGFTAVKKLLLIK